jgi:hypothetical protein
MANTRSQPPISLSDVLRHHKEGGLVKAGQLGKPFLVSNRTGYQILAGSWDETVESIAHAINTLPAPVADDILALLLAGGPYDVPPRRRREGDPQPESLADEAMRLPAEAADAARKIVTSAQQAHVNPDQRASNVAAVGAVRRRADGLLSLVAGRVADRQLRIAK